MAVTSKPTSKPTAVHFGLIFFVMMTLILMVVAFMFSSEIQEGKALQAKNQKDFQEAKTSSERASEQLDELKSMVGVPFAEVGKAGEQSPQTVLGALHSDIALAGPLAQDNGKDTIRKLVEEMRQLTAQRDQARADLDAEHVKFLKLYEDHQKQVDEQQTARAQANAALQAKNTSADEQLTQKDKDLEKRKAEYNELQIEKTNEKVAMESQLKESDKQIGNLRTINAKLQAKLTDIAKTTFERPYGVLRSVDQSSKVVYISLGKADRVPTGLELDVYTKSAIGLMHGEVDKKGKIQVTRVLENHLSEAHIVKDDIFNPMAIGDPIFTPIWSPGRVDSYSVVGFIDLNGDGKSDREILHDLIASAGAVIDNEVDDQGNKTGLGITTNTRFLVMGNIPDVANSKGKKPQDKINQLINKHAREMREEAREHGVKVLNLGDFLNHMEYRPQLPPLKSKGTPP